jgi:hypothetical protein
LTLTAKGGEGIYLFHLNTSNQCSISSPHLRIMGDSVPWKVLWKWVVPALKELLTRFGIEEDTADPIEMIQKIQEHPALPLYVEDARRLKEALGMLRTFRNTIAHCGTGDLTRQDLQAIARGKEAIVSLTALRVRWDADVNMYESALSAPLAELGLEKAKELELWLQKQPTPIDESRTVPTTVSPVPVERKIGSRSFRNDPVAFSQRVQQYPPLTRGPTSTTDMFESSLTSAINLGYIVEVFEEEEEDEQKKRGELVQQAGGSHIKDERRSEMPVRSVETTRLIPSHQPEVTTGSAGTGVNQFSWQQQQSSTRPREPAGLLVQYYPEGANAGVQVQHLVNNAESYSTQRGPTTYTGSRGTNFPVPWPSQQHQQPDNDYFAPMDF